MAQAAAAWFWMQLRRTQDTPQRSGYDFSRRTRHDSTSSNSSGSNDAEWVDLTPSTSTPPSQSSPSTTAQKNVQTPRSSKPLGTSMIPRATLSVTTGHDATSDWFDDRTVPISERSGLVMRHRNTRAIQRGVEFAFPEKSGGDVETQPSLSKDEIVVADTRGSPGGTRKTNMDIGHAAVDVDTLVMNDPLMEQLNTDRMRQRMRELEPVFRESQARLTATVPPPPPPAPPSPEQDDEDCCAAIVSGDVNDDENDDDRSSSSSWWGPDGTADPDNDAALFVTAVVDPNVMDLD